MFLKEDSPPQWRQLDEWENPVRGWLIINQANVSVQVFAADGETTHLHCLVGLH